MVCYCLFFVWLIAGWFGGWLVGGLVGCLGCLVGWLVGWLVLSVEVKFNFHQTPGRLGDDEISPNFAAGGY